MSDSDSIPPLRMAPRDENEHLAHQVQREQTIRDRKREEELEQSLAPTRVGSVPYLNSVPLTRGLEDQIVFAPPAQLAELLKKGDLDAALVSVTEVLFNDGYEVLDGVAVASLGEVKSVFVAHKKPIEEMDVVFCDAASLASVTLLKVLLAEKGLHPEFKPLEHHDDAPNHDYVLLIGNPAIDFRRGEPEHELWDLGQAWYELTNLPFVYAVWALKKGCVDDAAKKLLREAKDFGLDTLDHIISSRSEYDRDFRRDYLEWHIHFHLGTDEKRGLAKFIELIGKHQLGKVFEPEFVS